MDLTDVVVKCLAFSLIGLTVRLLFSINSYKKTSPEQNETVIKAPKMFLYIGIFSIAVGALPAVYVAFFYKGEQQIALWFLCALFELLGIPLAVMTASWRIVVYNNEDFFLYRNWVGKTYKIKYEDCLECNTIKNGYIIKTKTKKIEVSDFCVNDDYFLKRIRIEILRNKRGTRNLTQSNLSVPKGD